MFTRYVCIGACRPGHICGHHPGYFESCVYITRTGCEDHLYSICMLIHTHGRTCSISVVTNRLSAIAHQMRHSQVLPGYPRFVTCQMLDKINYDQASVQILVCTTEACRCTLLRQVYKFVLSSLSQLYKFVHLNVQICTLECTNLYTLDRKRGVQICTLMQIFSQITKKLCKIQG